MQPETMRAPLGENVLTPPSQNALAGTFRLVHQTWHLRFGLSCLQNECHQEKMQIDGIGMPSQRVPDWYT